ncbi:MAG: hypothetical protein ACD_72C00261G0002 [uncultured bacterium]|nr:MAG: hypothetical protein ACD_72C00261G0002 [uncultured bacterium]
MNFEKYKKYKKILLLYSGGLDTSFLLKYFSTELGVEVLTVAFDLGGCKNETDVIEQRAMALGSKKHFNIKADKIFVDEYCSLAIKANALFKNRHPLSSSLSRPLMAKISADIAKQNNCDGIMHGSNGWQNNSARFDTAILCLSDIKIVEPVMENNLSREYEYDYLKKHGIEIGKKEDNLLSSDNNIWGREIEDGMLENMYSEPDENIYKLTSDINSTPNIPAYYEIEFRNGLPIKLNGLEISLLDIIKHLNYIGGKHGVGRHDALEDKIIGYKMREIHESPAATILIYAHQDLEQLVLPQRTLKIKNIIDTEWTELACFGLWYHPARKQLDAYIEKTSELLNGTVRIKLFKSNIKIVGRKSKHALIATKLKNINETKFVGSSPNRNFYDFYAYESVIGSN